MRRGRRLAAGGMGPVLAVTQFTVPVALAAAVAVVGVARAAPAKAAGPAVLVLLQNGETTAPETTILQAAGDTVTQATPSTWEGMSASAFKAYAALVIGDPSSGGTCSSLTPTTGTSGSDALGTSWQSAVSGNVAVLGTAPAAAGTTAAKTLVKAAAGYAAAAYSSSSQTGTGLYVSLNCEDATTTSPAAVSFLGGVEGIGTAGGLAVQGKLACTDAGTVNTWEAHAAGTFGGFTSSSLNTGSWPSPACPAEEGFTAWPAMFTPVAYDGATDAVRTFTASDGAVGEPYVLLGAPVSAGTQALAPSTSGEVPLGSTAGGAANPAAPGVSQASAGDPVDTENGDFTQSATDLSIPGLGPALDFTRSYDAQTAQQQTQTGHPGAMGYGWTDNWASTLTAAKPVPGNIYTLAGLRTGTGVGGPAAAAALNGPGGAVARSGNVYIADTSGNRVLEVAGATGTQWGQSMTAGDVYEIADAGYGGPYAVLNHPEGLAFDSAGDLYIADSWDNRVEELAAASGTQWGQSMTADDMYTVAGSATGVSGSSGDGGAAASGLLYGPGGVAVDSAGNLFVADGGNNRVQEVAAASGTHLGQPMTADDIYTIAGGTAGSAGDGGPARSADLGGPESVAADSSGDVYIADSGNNRVQEIAAASGTQWGQTVTANDIYTIAGSATGAGGTSGDGAAASSALLDGPQDVIWTGGNLYVADSLNNRVQEIAGTAHTQWGQSMTSNDVYTIAGSASGTPGYSGDGGAATSAQLDNPLAVTLDGSANLYTADAANNRIREVTASTANISTFAGGAGTFATDGDNGPASQSGLAGPMQEAFDTKGDIYIADSGSNRIQEIAAYPHTQFGITMTAGDIYTVAGQANGTAGCQCDGNPATQAYLDGPMGIVTDAAGDLYIADTGNNRIQEVPATTGTQWGQSMTAGYMYTVAGQQYGASGYWGNGGPATSAAMNHPQSVAVDPAGDLYIADAYNSRIQEVPVASGTQWGQSMTAGDMYTIAGSATGAHGSTGDAGPAASALLYGPGGIALDSAGNLYIGDGGNNRVQEIAAATGVQHGQSMTKGDVYTIAGGTGGSAGDDGPATAATLDGPESIAVDPASDVYFTDSGNNRIQEIAATSGTQWSQSMTAGDIYTVAGSPTGAAGNAGDGGPATSGLMTTTESVSLDPEGDLYVTDNSNNTVREIASATAAAIPPAPGQTSALVIAPAGTAPGGITITQPGGAQITFYPKTGGTCTTPYVTAGGYCALPQDIGATLSYNSGTGIYTFTQSPGTSYTYSSTGQLTGETDAASNSLTISYNTPAPGSGHCPPAAHSCETITAASGRTLVLGSDSSGRVTSVTDPLARQWAYAYNSAGDLTTVTDPMSRVTTYTYGDGSTGNPQLANDLLTIGDPNAQPGGPDAGDSTVNVYDTLGRVTSQTDPMGWKTVFNYTGFNPATGNGTVTTSDPDGNSTVDDYTQGTLGAESKWTGTTLTSEQDYGPATTAGGTSSGTLLDAWTTDGDGQPTTDTYDAAGNTTSTTDPLGDEITHASTSLDQPSCDTTAEASSGCSTGPSPVSPGGVITPPSSAPPNGTSYTLYDTDGNELYMTTGVYQPGASSASYLRTTYTLYKNNSITLSSTNISCTTTPPSQSLPCATINADKVVTQLAYNSAGDLTSSATPDGNGSEIAKTTYTYDGDGEQTATTSPDGNLSGANAGNYTTTTAYNADSEKTTVTQAGGTGATATPRATGYGYDGDGNQATVQDARSYTTTTAYNADDKPALVTNPDGNATLTCYDGDGNTTQTVPPAGVAAGSLTPASCPATYPSGYGNRLASDATTFTYDAVGNQTVTTTPAPAAQTSNETTTASYDGAGNLIETIAPPTSNSGGAPDEDTYNSYNADGQLTTQTTGYGTSAASTTSYCYNPNGDQTAVVAPDGNTSALASCETSSPWVVSSGPYPTQALYQTTSSYDSAGELASTTSPATTGAPSGATTSFTYDPAGNTLTGMDPDGITTTWTYTPANLKAAISYSGSSAHPVSYTYDANGQTTAMTDASGSSSYTWNPFAELTSATNGASKTVGYSYDAEGNTTGTTYPLPSSATWATTDTVSYGYDHADLLTSVTDFNNHQITISNTTDGLPSQETLGSTGDTIDTNYDHTDTPSNISLANSSTTLQSFNYADAPSGAILGETDTPSSSKSPADYTYDAQSRVTSMTPGTGTPLNYGFDASGNLTTLPGGATGTYDHDGELQSGTLAGATTNYAYSPAGQRLTSKQGSTTIAAGTWNGAGELSTYSGSAANMTAAIYNGDGLRVSATTKPAGGSASTQNFVWDTTTSVPSVLMDSTNAYIGTRGIAPAEQVNLATGTIAYLVTDPLGSVRGVVGPSGGLTASTAYDSWGNPESGSGLTAYTPFGYASGYTDPTGLIYFLSRYYDSATGQFMSVDPDVSQTQNPYGYADGDPVSITDPTGAVPGDWEISGERCGRANLQNAAWCDLKLDVWAAEDGIRTDLITVTLTVNPGAYASRVNWRSTYNPNGHHLARVHINGFTLCYHTRVECYERPNIRISPTASGHFDLYTDLDRPYLRGDLVGHAFTLSAYCTVCGEFGTDSRRTGMARCNTGNNNCYYRKG